MRERRRLLDVGHQQVFQLTASDPSLEEELRNSQVTGMMTGGDQETLVLGFTENAGLMVFQCRRHQRMGGEGREVALLAEKRKKTRRLMALRRRVEAFSPRCARCPT